MIRKLLASTAFAALATASMAADLPSTKGPAPFIAPAPIFTWTGFYVGLNAGGAWNNNNGGLTPNGTFLNPALFFAPALPFITGGGNGTNGSFTGGIQAGYNWQFSNIVLGVEADANFRSTNNNGNSFITAFPAPIPAGAFAGATGFMFNRSNNNNFFGTARLRAGWAIDRLLLYVTGGVAFGGGNNGGLASFTVVPGVPVIPAGAYVAGGGNNNNIGWTLGGGAEYAFTNNWTAKVEYLYVNRGNGNRTLVPLAAPPILPGSFFTQRRDDFSVVRVGLNYKF